MLPFEHSEKEMPLKYLRFFLHIKIETRFHYVIIKSLQITFFCEEKNIFLFISALISIYIGK